MKTCPKCHTQYTDDTLRYCLQDGTALDNTRQSDIRTVFIGESETLVNPDDHIIDRDTRPDTPAWNRVPPTQPFVPEPARRSNTLLVVAVTALIMVIVIGALGFGAFLYLRDQGSANTTSNSIDVKPEIENQSKPKNSVTPIDRNADARRTDNQTTIAPIDNETRDEVARHIDSWRSRTEAMDLDSLMGHYAPTVDYYNRRSASKDFIRTDKNRAFSQFDNIAFNLSNFSITSDDGGKTATAVFDKEWRFEGSRVSTGKVRQQLRLARSGGGWVITAERDLKVY